MTLLTKGLLSIFLIGSSGGIVAGSYLWNNFSSFKEEKTQHQQESDVTSGEEDRKSQNTPNSLEPEQKESKKAQLEPTSEEQTST